MADHAEFDNSRGDVFLDARGHGRAMRLSWHPEADVVVLSLWREETCAGTFRMPHQDVGAFVDALVDSLRDAPGVHLPPRVSPGPAAAPSDPPGPQPRDVVADVQNDGLDETQAMPSQPDRPAFAEWAFGPVEAGDRANAS